MSKGTIEILDEGRTLSLRYGNTAKEIVADTGKEATTALAGLLFDEHEHSTLVEGKLRDAQNRIAAMTARPVETKQELPTVDKEFSKPGNRVRGFVEGAQDWISGARDAAVLLEDSNLHHKVQKSLMSARGHLDGVELLLRHGSAMGAVAAVPAREDRET